MCQLLLRDHLCPLGAAARNVTSGPNPRPYPLAGGVDPTVFSEPQTCLLGEGGG